MAETVAPLHEAGVVESIIEHRALWATCVAEQKDQTEISHASDLVSALADEISKSDISAFARDVLRRLPFYMTERKKWIFIACFCDDSNSELHWREYGRYCLTFPAPLAGSSKLLLKGNQVDCWYQRVVYDEALQRRGIDRALRCIVLALTKNTRGQNDGPWADAVVKRCAMETAQALLSLAVGFKRESFRQEREWRIVCAPRLAANSSAPTWIDEQFEVNIRGDVRHHVVLQIDQELETREVLRLAPVPFLDWAHDPNHGGIAEIQRINSTLKRNNRPDLMR